MCGEAMEVPEMVFVELSVPTQVERMFKPKMKRVRLLL